MILKKEIETIAEQQNVPKTTIDKDWVLGHFIDAIFSQAECRKNLVFKGGTCLRKCYFSDYRFSEDLDFTSKNKNFVLDKKLLSQIVNMVTERTEIPLFIQEVSPLQFNNQLTGYKAIVKFWGADHPKNQMPAPPERWTDSIKIEIILYEQLLFTAEEKIVFHSYSDKLSVEPLTVPCYSINEVLSEKLRALIQRSYTAPRDYYDIWYIANNVNNINWKEIVKAFHKKMKFKDLTFSGIHQLLNEDNDKKLKAAWKNSLAHQIPKEKLQDYEIVLKGLRELFEKVF